MLITSMATVSPRGNRQDILDALGRAILVIHPELNDKKRPDKWNATKNSGLLTDFDYAASQTEIAGTPASLVEKFIKCVKENELYYRTGDHTIQYKLALTPIGQIEYIFLASA